MKDITKNSSSYITRGLSFNSASRGATLNSRSNLHSDTFSGEALQLRSHSLDPQKPTALRGTFRGSPPHYNLGGAWVKKKMKKNKINVKNGLLNSDFLILKHSRRSTCWKFVFFLFPLQQLISVISSPPSNCRFQRTSQTSRG